MLKDAGKALTVVGVRCCKIPFKDELELFLKKHDISTCKQDLD